MTGSYNNNAEGGQFSIRVLHNQGSRLVNSNSICTKVFRIIKPSTVHKGLGTLNIVLNLNIN